MSSIVSACCEAAPYSMVNQWRVMWKEDWRGQDEAVQAIEHASMAHDHAAPVLDAVIALAAARGRTNPGLCLHSSMGRARSSSRASTMASISPRCETSLRA